MNKKLLDIYESFLNSESKKVQATKIILLLIAIAGVGALALTVPGIFAIGKKYKLSNRYSKKQIKSAYYALKRRKLIEIVEGKNGALKTILTNKGVKRIKEFSIDSIAIAKPKKWDKKWRVLTFDIPTKPDINNTARKALLYKIKELGFIQLQKSVWIHPYPCEDEILFITETFNVTKYIEILTVDKLLHENILLNKFKLNK